MKTPSELDLVVIKTMHERKVSHNTALSIFKVIDEEKVSEEEALKFIRTCIPSGRGVK